VVVGVNTQTVSVVIPGFTYGYPPQVLTNQFTISTPLVVYKVKILYCARAPHYFQAKTAVPLHPITGYVFQMKSGTKMDATTYTTGTFYYHLAWNGVNLPVAKDLVTNITAVR
jgi:hypothetical protein